MRSPLVVGLLLGVAANVLWGLAFLVPVLLADYPSAEIMLGRYPSLAAARSASRAP